MMLGWLMLAAGAGIVAAGCWYTSH